MTRYIALLRGINVGGITIKMAALADTVSALGHTGVKTVLASGNVVFDSDQTDAAALKAGLERALTEAFGYEAWVVLLSRDQLAAAVADYPFEARDGWHSYILFGSQPVVLEELLASASALDPALDPADERVQPGGVQPGGVQPGSVQPGSVQPGSVSPGIVSPGIVSPGSVLYWQVRREVGIKSPFSTLAAKSRYKASTTNRNLRTLQKILDLPG